jgi:NADPH-dependent 2,4-dienoyl-CoA reductase/sulfur reductase-like enzyme
VGRRTVVVVGASLAAVSFVEALRQRGGDHSVVLVGGEAHLPYDRPPLSKQFLLDPAATAPLLRPSEWFAEHNVELVLGAAATALETAPLAVVVGGRRILADDVVIATGSRARRWPGASAREGLHYLRTVDDAVELRGRLETPGRMVVLGAGFIGLEAAAAAVRRGWQVTVLERESSPLVRVVGATTGQLCVATHLREGVEIRCGSTVDGLLGDGRVRGVRFADGATMEADAVLAGIGAVPNTEWLDGSGVEVDDGIPCDASGRTGVPGVWAAGDVARWPNTVTGRCDRIEQWQAARDHGALIAGAMLDGGSAQPWSSPPYFWSDLFDAKVQFVGHCAADSSVHIVQRGARAVAVFGSERLEGVLTVSAPRVLALGRRQLMRCVDLAAAREWAEQAFEV